MLSSLAPLSVTLTMEDLYVTINNTCINKLESIEKQNLTEHDLSSTTKFVLTREVDAPHLQIYLEPCCCAIINYITHV